MNPPKISIIIPVYNDACFLSEALESIFHQTFQDWECIIINDGSTDNSHNIALKYAKKDARVHIIHHTENLGVGARRKEWIHASRWAYIVSQDADDIAHPDRLKELLNYMEQHPSVVVCWSAITLLHSTGRGQLRKYPTKDDKIREALFRYNPLSQSSTIIRRDALEKIGGFNETFSLAEDLDVWFRLGLQWKFANIERPLLCYRVRNNSTTIKHVTEMGRVTFSLRDTYQPLYKPNLWSKIIDRCERLVFLLVPTKLRASIFLSLRNNKLMQRCFFE